MNRTLLQTSAGIVGLVLFMLGLGCTSSGAKPTEAQVTAIATTQEEETVTATLSPNPSPTVSSAATSYPEPSPTPTPPAIYFPELSDYFQALGSSATTSHFESYQMVYVLSQALAGQPGSSQQFIDYAKNTSILEVRSTAAEQFFEIPHRWAAGSTEPWIVYAARPEDVVDASIACVLGRLALESRISPLALDLLQLDSTTCQEHLARFKVRSANDEGSFFRYIGDQFGIPQAFGEQPA